MARRMLIFGYSITFGFWDPAGGWVARLRKYLDEQSLEKNKVDYWNVYNLGIPGEILTELLGRFETEVNSRLEIQNDLIVLALGVNDSKYIHSKKKNVSDPSQFRKNFEKLLITAKKYSLNVIVVSSTPVDEQRVDPWKPGFSYKNDYIEKYNDILRDVCTEHSIDFINVYDHFKSRPDYKKLLEDGLHPNNKGHQLIFKIVKKFLEDNQYI